MLLACRPSLPPERVLINKESNDWALPADVTVSDEGGPSRLVGEDRAVVPPERELTRLSVVWPLASTEADGLVAAAAVSELGKKDYSVPDFRIARKVNSVFEASIDGVAIISQAFQSLRKFISAIS